MSQNLLYIRRYNSNKTMDAIDKDDIDEDEDDDDGRPRHGSNTSGQSARLGNFLTNSRQPMTLITPSHRGSRGSRGVFLSFSINSLTSGNILSTTQFSSSEASRGAIYDDPEDLTPPTPLPPHPFFKAPSKGQGQQKDKKTEREIKMEIEELQAQLDQMKKEKVKLLSEFSGSVYGQDENGESGINSFEGRPSEKGIDHADKVRENEVHAPLKSNDSEIPISKLLKKDSYSSKTEFNQEDFLKHLWCSPSSGAKGSGGVWRDVKENEPEISNKIHQRPKHTPNAIVNSFDGQFKCLDSDSEIMDDGVFENKFPEVDTMQDLEEITLPANPNIPHTRSRKTTGYLYNKHNSFDSSDSIQADVKSNSISHHDDVPGKNPSASETLPEDKSPLVLQENKSHSVLPDSKRPSILPEYKSPSEQSDESFIRPDLPPLKYPEHSPSPESDHITQLPPKKKSQDIPFESSPSQTTEYDDDENTRYQDYNDSNKASYSNATGSSHHNVSRYAGYMSSLQSLADHHGYIIKDVTPDGNCMFSAIIDQLRIQGNFDLTPNSLRKTAVDYLKENPKNQDGTHLESFLSTETWEEYLKRMGQESQWGDHMVLQACTEVTGQKIVVFKPNANKTVLVPTVEKASEDNTVTLGHIGESHFVSLRPKDWEANWPLMAQAHRVKKKEKQKLTKKKILERKKADKLKKISTPESSVRGESTSVDEKELTGTEETEGTTLEVLTDKKPVEEEDDEGDEDEEDDSQFKTTDGLLPLLSGCDIDGKSGVPFPHLQFVTRYLIHPSYIRTVELNAINTAMLRRTTSQTVNSEIIGSVAEGLCVELQNYGMDSVLHKLNERSTSMPKDSRGRRSKLNGKATLMGLAKTFRCGFTDGENDFYLDTTCCRPGYTEIRPAQQNPLMSHNQLFAVDDDGIVFLKNNSSFFLGMLCQTWPHCASGWENHHNVDVWPGSSTVHQIKKTPCVLLSRAHPHSEQSIKEWQIIFPYAEKLLAQALTPEMKSCFSLFKVLIDFHIHCLNINLTTTHLKTVMYDACEALPAAAWKSSPAACLLHLLDRLSLQIHAGILANYFVPQNNMIDHFSQTDRQALEERLKAVRAFPLTALVLLADSHGIGHEWLSSRVFEDCERFATHRDITHTIEHIFIPSLVDLATNHVIEGRCHVACSVMQDVYFEWSFEKYQDDCDSTERMSRFFKRILHNYNDSSTFTLMNHLDKTFGTNLITLKQKTGHFLTMKDIIGRQEAGNHADVFVGQQVKDDVITMIRYLDNYAFVQFTQGKPHNSAQFLRSAITKGKAYIQGGAAVNDYVNRFYWEHGEKHNIDDYAVHTELLTVFSHLIVCYTLTGKLGLFLEYLDDYQESCDRTGGNIKVYLELESIWRMLGNPYKADLIRQKLSAWEKETSGFYQGSSWNL